MVFLLQYVVGEGPVVMGITTTLTTIITSLGLPHVTIGIFLLPVAIFLLHMTMKTLPNRDVTMNGLPNRGLLTYAHLIRGPSFCPETQA